MLRIKKRFAYIIENSRFSLKPLHYTFITDKSMEDIRGEIGELHDIPDHIQRYKTMVGYCRKNIIVLFNMAFSARFFIMARPFTAHMYKRGEKTVISGNFKFSISAKILVFAWLFNDAVRIIQKLRAPNGGYAWHIVSISVLPLLLLRAVWKDRVHQQRVVDFMREELGAYEDKE